MKKVSALLIACLLLLSAVWADQTIISKYGSWSQLAVYSPITGVKTLSEGAATSFMQVAVPIGSHCSGTYRFDVYATDGVDYQIRYGDNRYGVVNKGGVETCDNNLNTNTAVLSSGTLACTYVCDTTPTNAVNLQFNCTSSLSQTTLEIHYTLTPNDGCTLTPQ